MAEGKIICLQRFSVTDFASPQPKHIGDDTQCQGDRQRNCGDCAWADSEGEEKCGPQDGRLAMLGHGTHRKVAESEDSV